MLGGHEDEEDTALDLRGLLIYEEGEINTCFLSEWKNVIKQKILKKCCKYSKYMLATSNLLLY